jgi:hypothetical protein
LKRYEYLFIPLQIDALFFSLSALVATQVRGHDHLIMSSYLG